MLNPRILVVTAKQSTITGLEPALGTALTLVRGRNCAEGRYQLQLPGDFAAVLAEHAEGSDEMIQLLAEAGRARPKARRLLLAEACDLQLVIRALHSGVVHKLIYHPIDARDVRTALEGILPAPPPPRPYAQAAAHLPRPVTPVRRG